MKRLVQVTVFLAASIAGSAGHAADLRVRPPLVKVAPAPVVTAYNWSGLYIGVNGGGAWGQTRHDKITAPMTTTGDFDISGGLVGGTGGFNWQIGPWVLGVEGDVDWSDSRGSVICPNTAFTCSTKITYVDTVRGRVGYAWDRFLIYGTVGEAFGRVKQGFTPSFNGANGGSAERSGLAAGGGVEFALWWPRWTAKIEYLHVDFGSFDCTFTCTGVPGEVVRIKADENIVRAGVNFRLN
jgi:outer membrane immunogenic protein